MAFPTTGILDDFDRPDESPLSDGGKWADRNNNGDLQVLNNKAQGIVGSTTLNSNYWADSVFGPASEAYITVATLPNADYIRLWLRLQNPGAVNETGYMMQWANDANGLRIFKETARETYTMLAQDAAARFVATDQLGFEAIATDLTVYKDGVAELGVSDGTTTAAGNIALGCRSNTCTLSDFGGGTVVSATDVLSMQTHVFGHSVW